MPDYPLSASLSSVMLPMKSLQTFPLTDPVSTMSLEVVQRQPQFFDSGMGLAYQVFMERRLSGNTGSLPQLSK